MGHNGMRVQWGGDAVGWGHSGVGTQWGGAQWSEDTVGWAQWSGNALWWGYSGVGT